MIDSINAFSSTAAQLVPLSLTGSSQTTAPASTMRPSSTNEISILPWPGGGGSTEKQGMLQMFQMLVQLLASVIQQLLQMIGGQKAGTDTAAPVQLSAATDVAGSTGSTTAPTSSTSPATPSASTPAATTSPSTAVPVSSTNVATTPAPSSVVSSTTTPNEGLVQNFKSLFEALGNLVTGKIDTKQFNENIGKALGSIFGQKVEGAYQVASEVAKLAFDWGKEILGMTILKPVKWLSKLAKGMSKGAKLLKKIF